MRPALLAALLALAAPSAGAAYDPFEDQPPEADHEKRLLLTAWGGGLVALQGSGNHGAGLVGGEVALRLRPIDLGVQVTATRLDPGKGTTPIVLFRIGQTFETRSGVEGSLTLGLGSARRERWDGWFQLSVGGRVPLGPLFLAAELAFEQVDFLRLAAGLGAAF